MTKVEYEQKMTGFFTKLLGGSGMRFDPATVSVFIEYDVYKGKEADEVEWTEETVDNKIYDHVNKVLIDKPQSAVKHVKIRELKTTLPIKHPNAIRFSADILSQPFRYKDKWYQWRFPEVFFVRVNGTHDTWHEEEVRAMIIEMSTNPEDGIFITWDLESSASFAIERKNLEL